MGQLLLRWDPVPTVTPVAPGVWHDALLSVEARLDAPGDSSVSDEVAYSAVLRSGAAPRARASERPRVLPHTVAQSSVASGSMAVIRAPLLLLIQEAVMAGEGFVRPHAWVPAVVPAAEISEVAAARRILDLEAELAELRELQRRRHAV